MNYQRLIAATFGVALSAGTGSGQTTLDLRTQSKNIDFSSAPATRPFKTGAALPAGCVTGETYFKTNAAAGANLYACTATNTWSVMGDMPHAAAGDVTGVLDNLTVAALQNRPVASISPSSGQVLAWSAGNNRWEPQTVSGGGGPGGGSSTASQLGDFSVSRDSGTVLTMGAACSILSPCNVRFGTTVYTVTSPATVTLASGTGTVYLYMTKAGALMAGHNLGLTCAGNCTAVSGVAAFPADSLPLYSWSATNGVWDATGADQRAFLSAKTLVAGAGLINTESGNQTTVAINSSQVGMRVAVPGSSATPCTAGFWAADNSYYYICHTDNSWGRISISSW